MFQLINDPRFNKFEHLTFHFASECKISYTYVHRFIIIKVTWYFIIASRDIDYRHSQTRPGDAASQMRAGGPQGSEGSLVSHALRTTHQSDIGALADDTAISPPGEDPASRISQEHLNRVEHWLRNWKIKVDFFTQTLTFPYVKEIIKEKAKIKRKYRNNQTRHSNKIIAPLIKEPSCRRLKKNDQNIFLYCNTHCQTVYRYYNFWTVS